MTCNLTDCIDLIPNPVPANAIPIFDGCRWTLISIPAGITCNDVLSCVQGELNSLQSQINAKLDCADLGSCQTIIDIQDDITALPADILSQVYFNVYDGTTVDRINNQETLAIRGIDGIRFYYESNNVFRVGLPAGASDGQQLVWNSNTNKAVRRNPMDVCCDFIHSCMQPITDSLQNQINNIQSGGTALTDDFVVSGSYNEPTNTITLTRALGGSVPIVLTGLINNDTEDYVASGAYNDTTKIITLTMAQGGTVPIDLTTLTTTDDYVTSASFNDVTNILTLTRDLGGTVTVDLSALDGGGGVVTDELVKVTSNDTTPGYLRPKINNIAYNAAATANTTAIKVAELNNGGNEFLEFGLDLTTYTGNVTINGAFNVTGLSTLNDVAFSTGADVNWTNSNNTGTQTFGATYVGNYTNSDINYLGTTTIEYAVGATLTNNGILNNTATSVTTYADDSELNLNGDVTYGATSQIGGTANYVGITENYDATSATTYADNSTFNMNGDTNYGATSVETYQTGSTVTGELTNNNLTENRTGTNAVNYNDTMTITYAGTETTGTVNNVGLTENYDATSTINNNGNDINNTGNTITNTGVTENYDATSTLTNLGDTILTDATITNGTVTNLTTNNIITDNYNLQYKVRLVFDDSGNSLPLSTTTQIDGITVVDGDLVYVKDSATAGQVGKIYQAAVTGTTIVWTEVYTLTNGDTYYTEEGTVYGDVINNFSDTTETTSPSIPVKKTGITWTTGTSLVVTDADVDANTVILGRTVTAGTQVGFREFTMASGSFTINSTASETSLTFNYVIL